MSSNSSIPWPPSGGLTTIVVPRGQEIVKAAYSIHIAAPASQVFKTLRETSTYPKWNTFIPRVTVDTQPPGATAGSTFLESGTTMTFYAVMDPAKPKSFNPTLLAVTDVSTPEEPSDYVAEAQRQVDDSFTTDLSSVYRMSWREGDSWMSRGLRVERFHEVIVRGENECEVRTWELQTSVLAYVIRFMYAATIQARFKDWCEGLKTYCEQEAEARVVT